MRRLFKHLPKELPLHKADERRIVALLSSLPRVEPEIEIRELAADFEVDLVDHPHYLVPLEVGAEAFYSEYSGRDDREFLEASFVRVARRVRSEGQRSFDVYETGGCDEDGRFSLYWDFVYHPRDRRPPHLTSVSEVKVADGTYHVAGYATVKVGGFEYECMRVLYTYQAGDKPESLWLDEMYLARSGRVVLSRRYRSLEEYTEWMDWLKEKEFQRAYDETWEEDFATARSRLTHNGQEFYLWFDRLTDLTLGRLIRPEWKPPRKMRKGRRVLSWR